MIEISCAACGWVAITAQPVNAVWREHEEGCQAVGGAVRFMPDHPRCGARGQHDGRPAAGASRLDVDDGATGQAKRVQHAVTGGHACLDGKAWPGFFVEAAVFLLIAALAGWIASKALKAGAPPVPEQAIEEAKLTKEMLERETS